LGELLLERGVIDQDQLTGALAYQRQWGHRLGASLVAKGFMSEGQLAQVLGEALGIKVIDLSSAQIDPRAASLLDPRFCQTHELVPIALVSQGSRRVLTCAMTDPLDMAAVDEIEFTADCKLNPVLSPLSQIRAVLQRVQMGRQVPIPTFEDTQRKIPERMEILHSDGKGGQSTITLDAQDKGRSVGEGLSEEQLGEIITVGQELTDRTELAEIIREHERVVFNRAKRAGLKSDLDYLLGVNNQDAERLDQLERLFWSLMRLLAKKGTITREEFETQFRSIEEKA